MQLQNLHRTPTPVVMNPSTLAVGNREFRGYDQSYYKQEMARARERINNMYPGMYRFRGPEPQGGGGQGMAQMQQLQMMQMMQQAQQAQAMSQAGASNNRASPQQTQYKTVYEQRLAQMAAMSGANNDSGPEEITLDGEPTTQQMPNIHGPSSQPSNAALNQIRNAGRVTRPALSARGGGRAARGGRRGRPRLDPDTDLDFSPEPMADTSQQLLRRLQQAGVTTQLTPKSSDGNES